MNIATCPYCGGDIRFTATPRMGETVLCPVCRMAAIVVWLSPVVLEDTSQMAAEAGRPAEFGRTRERSRRRSGQELDDDRDDLAYGRKRRVAEAQRRRQGNRSGWYYDE